MTKRVKLPGDGEERGLEEADLSIEDESPSDADVQGSEDVSDYEGQPRAAPRQAYFGADRCRIKFQLKGDQASAVVRVCGGTMGECGRKHHKQGDDRAPVGFYDTIVTRACVDGILDTFRSRSQQEARDKAHRRVVDEATEELVGSKAYRTALRSVAAEMGHPNAGDTPAYEMEQDRLRDIDGWSYTSTDDYENAKMPAGGGEPRMDESIRKDGSRQPRRQESNSPNREETDLLAAKVRDIEVAVTKMASLMTQLTKDQATRQEGARRGSSPQQDSSEDEVAPSPRAISKAVNRLPRPRGTTRDGSRHYYAVARGRRPGVYPHWEDAERQVNGFSGALHKKFKTSKEAQRFVDWHRPKPMTGSEEDEEDDGHTSHTSAGSDEDWGGRPRYKAKERDRKLRGAVDTRANTSFPPLSIAAPDPSIGNSKELFKMSLGSEEEMAEKLSPPGLDRRTMQELANATLDAIQLPGTSTTETLDGTGELVGALREMTTDRQYEWAEDRPQKDSLWRTAGRTSILTIKTAEALQERVGEFAGIPEEMFETQVHRFRTIFSRLRWSEDRIQAWSANNWFLRIGKDTLDLYVALHLHLFTLSNTEGWTYAQEALKYYGAKLLQFRKTNTSRLVCLLKIYIFLRDARKNDFYSAKLQEKRNHAMLAKISALETTGGKGSSDPHKCKKCGLDQHPGGVKKCWFRNLPDAEAKKRGALLMTKLGKMSPDEINTFVGGNGAGTEE